jgi:hypothetical protein
MPRLGEVTRDGRDQSRHAHKKQPEEQRERKTIITNEEDRSPSLTAGS